MSLDMNEWFRERFQGHEAPVDPSAWDAIQSKLAMGAPATDAMSKLFQEKFHGHEAAVEPSAWSNISSQLGHPAATGVSSFWGWAAAGVTALAIGGAALFMNNNAKVEVAEIPQITNEIHIPAVGTTALPVEINARIASSEPNDKEHVVVNTVVPKSVVTAEPASVRSLVPEQDSPVPIVSEPVDGSAEVATDERDERSAKVEVEYAKPVYGPIIVAQIIDEMTTKAAEAAKEELDSAEQEPKPSTTPSVVDEPSQNSNDPTLTEDKPVTPLPELFIPNTFTPNGDNINDTFEVIAEGYEKIMVRIFSVKENVQVFSTDIGSEWTGDNCSDGYYLVAVEAITKDGRSKTGSVMVWLNRNRLN